MVILYLEISCVLWANYSEKSSILLVSNNFLLFQLLWEKMLKMQQMQTVGQVVEVEESAGFGPSSMTSSSSQARLDRSDALRLSGSNLHSSQKLIRDLYHRMVTLEQKMRHLEISNEVVRKSVWGKADICSSGQPFEASRGKNTKLTKI